MISQEDFEEAIKKFNVPEEKLGSFWGMARELLKKGYEIEAYILILATWNFAGFRYVIKNFDIKKFENTIKEINPVFDKLKEERFETANFDKLKEDISFVYKKLKELVKQTGASKVMALKNPALFIMWDTKIRDEYRKKGYSIRTTKSEAEDYINFLKAMKKEFTNIKWINQNPERTFAKAIDEYNFVVTSNY